MLLSLPGNSIKIVSILCIFKHLLENLTGVWQPGKIVNDMQLKTSALDQHFNPNVLKFSNPEFKNIK